MEIFKLINGVVDAPAISREDVTTGEIYNLKGSFEEGIHNDERQVYFYEYNKPYQETIIMADIEGRKAFAIHTNDSVRDDFPRYHLSKVLAKNGNYIIYAYSTDARTEDVHSILFRILDNNPKSWYDSEIVSVNAEVICKATNLVKPIHKPFLKQAVGHVNNIIRSSYSDCESPKYCINPGRVVELRLFQKDDDGELISYSDLGKKLMVSKKSFERHTSISSTDDVLDNTFIRCFYSRKYKDEDVIYVDGYTLPMMEKYDVYEYLEKSKEFPGCKEWKLYKASTSFGNQFYVIKKDGDVRAVYKLADGFATFPINVYEMDYIDYYEPVTV